MQKAKEEAIEVEGRVKEALANTQFVAPAMGSVFAFTPAQNGYTYTLLNGTVAPSASETSGTVILVISGGKFAVW